MTISTNSTSLKDELAGAASDQAASLNSNAKPPANPRDVQHLRHLVLSAVHTKTHPAKLPSCWELLRQTSKVRQLSCSPSELAESLREKFQVEQLLQVGAFEHRGSEPATLNANLAVPSSKLLFDIKNKTFCDVRSALGALAYVEAPAVHYASSRIEYPQQQEKRLLAASDDDLHVLTRLGFNCDFAKGLDCITGQQVQEIFRQDNQFRLKPKYELILVGWQMGALDARPPGLIVEILERLSHAAKLYKVNPAELFRVWTPARTLVSEIKLAIDFQDEGLIRDICARSLASLQSPVEARFAMAKPQRLDYAAAERNLMRVIEICRDMPSPNSVRAAVDQLNDAFDKSVVQKFHEAAATTTSPIDRLLMLEAAVLAKAWYQSQSIFDSARRVMALETPRDPTGVTLDELKNLFGIIDKFLKIRSALESRKR